MSYHVTRGIPITKNNIVFVRILIIFTCSMFLIVGTLNIIKENEKYQNIPKFNDIRQIEAKVIEVTEDNITSYDKIVGKAYNYNLEYIINGIKYKTKSSTFSYDSKPIQPLNVGDTKSIVVYRDDNGKYLASKNSYKSLLAESAKNEALKNERIINNFVLIIFMLFPIFIGLIFLLNIKASDSDEDSPLKQILSKFNKNIS